MKDPEFPYIVQTVLDCTDARELAEFYRQLLGLKYRPGHEPTGTAADAADWLVLRDANGANRLAFQQVAKLQKATWPEGPIPQQLHLDLSVRTKQDLDAQHDRAITLGAKLLQDRSDDPQEPIRIYADPAGHPFCIFVWAGMPTT